MSCFGDSTGPGESRTGHLSFMPTFNPGSHLVDFDQVRVVLTRPGSNVVVLDTIVDFPASADSIDLTLNVPIEGSSEAFEVVMDLIDLPSGATVFRIGPAPVTAAIALGTPQSLPPFLYVGPGANASGVRFVATSGSAFFGDTVVFSAEAFDASNVTIPGTPIMWSVSDTSRATVVADSLGRVVARTTRGPVSVIASLLKTSAAAPPSVSGALAVQPRPNAINIQSGNTQSGAVGSALSQPLTARVLAADQLGVMGVPVTFAVSAGGGSVSQVVDTTDANGDVAVTWTLGGALGAQSVTASVAGIAGATAIFGATGSPGAGARLAFQVEPSSANENVVIAPAVTVRALDQFGNVSSSFTGNVTLAILNNAGGGTLGGTLTRAAVAGVATFNDLAIDITGAGYTLLASAANLASDTSAAFAIIANQPAAIAFDVQPSNVVAGSAISPAIQVSVRNASNAVITGFNGTVTLSPGNNPGGATLGGTLNVNAVAGVATFNNITLDRTGTGYTLVAGAASLTLPSAAFDVSAGPAAILSFSTQPPPSTIFDSPFITVATARDGSGNVASSYTGPVTLGIGNNPSGGALYGTLTVNAVAGVATFSGIEMDNVGAGYTLTANATGLGGAASAPLDVVAPLNGNAWINPAGGSWSTAANWSKGTVPNATDTVFIRRTGTYTVNLDVTAQVNRLIIGGRAGVQTLIVGATTMTSAGTGTVVGTAGRLVLSGSGTLTGSGSFQVFGGFDWQGGTLSGSAGAGFVQIEPGATALIGGTSVRNIQSYDLRIGGTGTWTGTQTVQAGLAGAIVVASGGTLDVQGDPFFNFVLGGGLPRIEVQSGGSLTRSGTGVLRVNGAFENDGQVTVSSGTLRLQGGTFATSTGSYTAGASATLDFNGGTHALAGGVGGAGLAQFTSGPVNHAGSLSIATVDVSGGTFNYNGTGSTSNLSVSTGSLGGSGQLDVTGAFSWTGGAVAGAGGSVRVLNGATLAMSGPAARTFTNMTVEVLGTGTWTSAHVLNAGLGAILRVGSGGSLDIQGDPNFTFNQGGTQPTFHVVGNVTRSTSAAPALFNVAFDNDGLVTVSTGTLRLQGGTGASGAIGGYTVGTGATIDFNAGTHALLNGSNVGGAGTVQVSGSATVNAAGNWSLGGTTQITSGTLNYSALGGSTAVLDLSGGVLGGAAGGTLGVGTSMSWTGGAMQGAGGTVLIPNGATLAISGGAARTFSNYIVDIQGSATWTGTQTVNTGLGAILRVALGGTLDIQGNPTVTFNQGGTATVIHVLGALTRSTSAGAATFNTAFENDGQATVSSGSIVLQGGSGAGSSDGAFTTASPSTAFDFNGGTHNLGAASTVNGAGVMSVSGATINAGGNWAHGGLTQISGGALNYSAAGGSTQNLTVSGGTLGGAAGGILLVPGAASWSGGNFAGAGGTMRVPAGGVLVISGTAARTFTNYTIDVLGSATWTGTHTINTGLSAAMVLSGAGTMDLQGNPLVTFNQGGNNMLLQVTPAAVLTRSISTGLATLNSLVDVDGQLNAQTGTLFLGGGTGAGTADGSYNVSGPAGVNFSGGTHNLGAGGNVTGAGFAQIGGATVNAGGGWAVSGTTQVTAGDFNYNGASGTTSVMDMSGGVHGGSGLFVITGTMGWSGGNLIGSGTTRIGASGILAVTGLAGRTFTGRTLDNLGTATWSTNSTINSGLGAVMRNSAGGTWNLTGDGTISFNQGGTNPRFDNFGAFVRGTSTGTANWNLAFNHSGGGATLAVNSGTLSLTGGGAQAAPVSVGTGAFLDYAGGGFVLNNGYDATGTGTVRVTAGSITNTTAADTARFANLTLTNGTITPVGGMVVNTLMDWNAGGAINGTGTTRIATSATMTITGAAGRSFTGSTLLNQGTTNWSGNNSINTGQGAIWRNAGTASFVLSGNGFLSHNQGGAALFDNLASFTRNTSVGTATIDAPFNHSAVAGVAVSTGVLNLTGGGVHSQVITIAGGAFLDYTAGTFTLNNGHNVIGAGTARLQGGTFNNGTAADTGRFANLQLTAGTLSHIGGIVATGTLNWDGGAAIQGPGTVRNGGTMAVTGLAGRSFTFGTILNQGTTTWSGNAAISTGNGAVWRTALGATFNLTGDGNLAHNQGGAASFVNLGTFSRNTSTGVAIIDAPFIDTTGTFGVATGILRLSGGARLGGTTKTITLGATLDLPTGIMTFRTGAQIGGTGVLAVSGGILTPDSGGTAQITNVNLSAGSIAHEGILTIGGTGALNWTGGDITSNSAGLGGTTQAGSTSVINISGLAGRSFTGAHTINIGTGGSATWSGNANISTGLGARIIVGGLFNVTGDGVLNANQGGTDTVRIAAGGILRRSVSTGVARLEAVFDKVGAFEPQTGTLQLAGGSVLNFTGTTNGAGLIDLNGGVFSVTAPLTVTGNIGVSAGTLALGGSRITQTGNLSTSISGLLSMTAATDSIFLTGNLGMAGGLNALTAGGMRVSGSFTQTGAGVMYAPTGTHTMILDGNGAQNISFANATGNFFRTLNVQATNVRNIVLQTNVLVQDTMIMLGGAQVATLIGSGALNQRLRVNGVTRINIPAGLTPRLAPPVLEVVGPLVVTGAAGAAPAGHNADTTVFLGGAALPVGAGFNYNSVRVATGGAFTMVQDTIPGDFTVSSGTAQFGFTGNFMANKFITVTGGLFSMTAAGTNIIVADSAVIFGGNTTGLLTAGNFTVRGNFVQGGNGVAFAPTSTHLTTFGSPGAAPTNATVFFTNPATSFFNNVSFSKGNSPPQGIVTLLSDARAAGTASVVGSTHLTGPGRRMRVDGQLTATVSTISPIINGLLALELGATPNVNITATADTIVFIGTMGAMPATGFTYTNVRVGTIATTVSIPAGNVASNFVISSGTANFNGTGTTTIGGDLITHNLGAFSQTGAGSRIIVVGNALFGGGTSNAINNGILELRGGFTQTSLNSGASFQATNAHTTNFAGGVGANRQAVNVSSPGFSAATSRFGRVQMGRVLAGSSSPVAIELLSNVQAGMVFDTSTIATLDTIFASSQLQTLTTDTLQSSDLVFNGTRVVLGNSTTGGTGTHVTSTIRFTNMITTQSFLTVHRSPGAATLTLAGLNFISTPTGAGRYVVANMPVNGAVTSVTLQTAAPANGCALSSRTGNIAVPNLSWNGNTCP